MYAHAYTPTIYHQSLLNVQIILKLNVGVNGDPGWLLIMLESNCAVEFSVPLSCHLIN
jgi:hypothetical protein